MIRTEDGTTASVDLVIARYNEDLHSWLKALVSVNLPAMSAGCGEGVKGSGVSVTVYDKGGDVWPLPQDTIELLTAHGVEIVRCENNTGREADTWLRHVIRRLQEGRVADVTVLLQGNPKPHMQSACAIQDTIVRVLSEWMGRGKPVNECAVFDNQPYEERRGAYSLPVEQHFRELLGRDPPDGDKWRFAAGAQYLVGRDCITQQSLEFYEMWHARLLRCKHTHFSSCTQYDMSYIDAWSCERLWQYVWDHHMPK
jgi:hypothetical protein